jgi:hypothetical protein
MAWQEMAAISIVAATMAAFGWSRFRRRPFGMKRKHACSCAAAGLESYQPSVVFRARRGERPQVLIRARAHADGGGMTGG